LKILKNQWSNPPLADELEVLRYRSNLLGADLRITNFAGGNTSSKIAIRDPLTGESVVVLAVKGSGGDLGSIRREGFALLYLDKLESLKRLYRGEGHEDEMAGLYPLCTFGVPSAPPSIDTPLHAFLPFPHVDHLHPDWAIAIAAAANGREKLAEFNGRFGHRVIWIPWLRPGFELGLRMQQAVESNPGCDGILLANHGLFTWGETQEKCYRNSLRMIDDMGQFVREYEARVPAFGGQRNVPERDPVPIMRELRDRIGPSIGHFDASPDVMEFVNSVQAAELAAMGTSCPDHFIRTRVAPAFLDGAIDLEPYRRRYTAYYEANREPDSPSMRSANPSVVLVPGAGMFTFARSKREAQITSEFYLNAIHVMRGATALGGGEVANYTALPEREAFRIEYWSLEEAKLRRMPPEPPLSRKIALIDGEDFGWGEKLAALGAEVSRGTVSETVLRLGGVDIAVNVSEPVLAEARPEWVMRTTSSDNIEVTAYAQALSRH
jgi:rhamnose utilization protein RhaD (predicted bifunctional aldolase and dehydrogenase)